MVVYVDVAFAINFLVDSCLLLVTGYLLRQPARFLRVFAAAALGSLYAIAILFPGTSTMDNWVVKWLVSVFMVQLAFSYRLLGLRSLHKMLSLLQGVAVFYAVTFAAGGAVYGLHNLFSSSGSLFSGLALVDGRVMWWSSITTLFMVTSFPVGLFVLRALWIKVQHTREQQGDLCEVVFCLSGQEARLGALLDTGNRLVDPIMKQKVAVVEATAVVGLLPASLRAAVTAGSDPLQALYKNTDVDGLEDRLTIIAFQAVGATTGHLLAIRPDEAWVVQHGEKKSIMPIWMALQNSTLSRSGRYHSILPADVAGSEVVLEGGEGVAHARSDSSQNTVTHSSHSA